jgi:hypothetical protein
MLNERPVKMYMNDVMFSSSLLLRSSLHIKNTYLTLLSVPKLFYSSEFIAY